MEERKDPAMRNQRSFSIEFKRQVVEELMSGESRPAQLCRRYNITSSVLYHWKRQYSRGKFNNEPTAEEGALRDRVEKLERLVGKLTLENEFLKRGSGTASASLKETGYHCLTQAPHQVYPPGVWTDEPFKEQLLLQAKG
jgi:transposase-like protein